MFAYKGDEKSRGGNTLTLLKDGEEFYAQLLRRIRRARREIFLETFILADDRIGNLLRRALLAAVRRGVWVSVTADSYGTFFLKDEYIYELSRAGVIFQIYDPQPKLFNSRPKVIRRLHRKLAVIDNTYAFVGGINLCDDHLTHHNANGKRDFAVEIVGPVVQDVRRLCASYVREVAPDRKAVFDDTQVTPPPAHYRVHQNAEVAFISRDNRRNRSEIEKAYLAAIHRAKKSVTIANAYFFPGYRMIRAMRKATARGVRVRLILQGNPDIPMALRAAQCLYDTLIRHNIELYEYTERPLHAKIATIDDNWSSIGSSNLDPWSLSLNLEANIFVDQPEFNTQLREEMEMLIEQSRRVEYETLQKLDWVAQMRNTLLYHFLRRLPGLVTRIPNPHPRVEQLRRIFTTKTGESRNKHLARAYPESKNARQVVVERRSQTLGEV